MQARARDDGTQEFLFTQNLLQQEIKTSLSDILFTVKHKADLISEGQSLNMGVTWRCQREMSSTSGKTVPYERVSGRDRCDLPR